PDLYIEHLVEVFRAVRRVLRSDGMLALNLGDSYATTPGPGGSVFSNGRTDGRKGNASDEARLVEGRGPVGRRERKTGLPAGNLLGIPWRVALALQGDGWILRSAMALIKSAPMPESMAGVRWEPCRRKVKGCAPRHQPSRLGSGGTHRDTD